MASRGRSVLRCVLHDLFAIAAKGLIVIVLWSAETFLVPLARAQQATVALPEAPGASDNNGCVQPVRSKDTLRADVTIQMMEAN